MNELPTSPLTVKDIVIHRQNNVAIYYTMTLVDADGKIWIFQNAGFTFDMKPKTEDEPTNLEVS